MPTMTFANLQRQGLRYYGSLQTRQRAAMRGNIYQRGNARVVRVLVAVLALLKSPTMYRRTLPRSDLDIRKPYEIQQS